MQRARWRALRQQPPAAPGSRPAARPTARMLETLRAEAGVLKFASLAGTGLPWGPHVQAPRLFTIALCAGATAGLRVPMGHHALGAWDGARRSTPIHTPAAAADRPAGARNATFAAANAGARFARGLLSFHIPQARHTTSISASPAPFTPPCTAAHTLPAAPHRSHRDPPSAHTGAPLALLPPPVIVWAPHKVHPTWPSLAPRSPWPPLAHGINTRARFMRMSHMLDPKRLVFMPQV